MNNFFESKVIVDLCEVLKLCYIQKFALAIYSSSVKQVGFVCTYQLLLIYIYIYIYI